VNGMAETFRVLFVEDQEADVTRARHALEHDGLEFEWRRVATESEFGCALADFNPDIVLCDYTLPGYSGRAALDLIQRLRPRTPLLFVVGSIGEECAIACLKYGAADYLLKANLLRLGTAVRRAIGDARERERTQEAESSHLRMAEVLEASPDMVVMSDTGGRITYVTHAACVLLGQSRDELLGAGWTGSYAAPLNAQLQQEVLHTAIENGSWQGEVTIAAPSGAAVVTSQVVTAHKDTTGTTRFFSMISREMADRNSFEARIHQLINYDSLTGLPNIAYMGDCVRRWIVRADDSGSQIALVSVNLDGFRLVDEGFGRALGDVVLKSVGAALKAAVRERDAVARVGPDEFLVILGRLAHSVDAAALVQRILDAIAAPRSFAGHDLQVTASAGIAVYPNDGKDFETLLRNASAAMHDVKSKSHGGLQFHSGDVQQRAQRRLGLENGLRNAVRNRELSVLYQPQYEIKNGRACGVEALARWFTSAREAIPPAVFIPVAEQAGLISELGAWVLQEACETVAAWTGQDEEPPTLCVNVSAHQICKEFSAVIARALEHSGFPAERLELEITESMLLGNAELALECLAQWKGLGVRIAVDDFGTGYSSLSYLSRLPVDRLKVDKALVHAMTSEPKAAAIVRTVVSLGDELGITVLAEGVETEQQLAMLKDLGCQQMQGYLLAVPAPAAEARALLGRRWGARRVSRSRAAHAAAASLRAP
jgi:diguanylate cyclase (GGDEF)-like protein/PAS domain S-box-containing protein